MANRGTGKLMSRRKRSRSHFQPAPPADGARIRVRVCFPGVAECRRVPADQASEALAQPGSLVWVEVRDPEEREIQLLAEEFGFHRLALEDVAKGRQRPKIDEYPGYYYLVLHALAAPSENGNGEVAVTSEVDMFVGRNFLVTVYRGEVPALEEAARRWERTEPELRCHVGFLLHTVMDSVIDAYFPVVDAIEDRLDDFELSLYANGGSGSPESILEVKRTLFTLRRAIYPMREVFNVLLSRRSFFPPEALPYFQDVYDHVLRLLDVLDIQRDMATGILDAYLAAISNRLNETMKRLTVLGIVVALMGAVFGAWGMNFDRVPLAHHPNGFWMLVGLLGVLVACALALARRARLW